MNNVKEIVKWISIAVCFVVVFLLVKKCSNGPKQGDTKITIRDTTIFRDTGSIRYVPVPVIRRGNVERSDGMVQYVAPIHDRSIKLPKALVEDSGYLRQEDYELWTNKIVYLDTVYKGQYGFITVRDSVDGTILDRSIHRNLAFPTITETKIQEAPKKVIAYVGFGLFGNKAMPLIGGHVSFGLKFKNDLYIGAMALTYGLRDPAIGLEVKIPIR